MRQSKLQGKSNLARLMAIENLYVTHDPNARTASFDLKKRVVTLPVLQEMSGPIYDGFIAHEISHAVNTPPDQYIQLSKDTHPVIANVCEDARIEKLIKRKYPGCIRDFYEMYKDFASPERDFFKIKDTDIDKLTLVDKLNLKFKIGAFIDVNFTQEEQYFVNLLARQETFEDVEKASKELFKWMKDNKQIKEVYVTQVGISESSENGEGELDENGNPIPKDGQVGEAKEFVAGDGFEQLGKVDDNLQKSMQNIFRDRDASDSIFGDIHKLPDYNKYVFEENRNHTQTTKNGSEYWNFLSSVSPTVNMMVSHFNMRKAARDYHRIKTSKTGVLNTRKISNYKMTDDLFKRNAEVPDSKNHGFVMFVDWSSSMATHMASTIKQCLVLMEFCRKIQIPFEVYGFTTTNGIAMERTPANTVYSYTGGKAFLLFKSSMRTEAFRKRSEWIYECVTTGYTNTIHEMRSTPLNFISFLAEPIVKAFQKKFSVEKTSLIMLSDGAPTDFMINQDGYIDQDKLDVIMRDTNTCKNYTVKGKQAAYHSILAYVKDSCNLWKSIGFYVTNKLSYDAIRLVAPEYETSKHDEVIQKFNTDNVFLFPASQGFDKYFAMSVNNFPVKNDDGKYSVDKKNSMVFLRKFIEEIS